MKMRGKRRIFWRWRSFPDRRHDGSCGCCTQGSATRAYEKREVLREIITERTDR